MKSSLALSLAVYSTLSACTYTAASQTQNTTPNTNSSNPMTMQCVSNDGNLIFEFFPEGTEHAAMLVAHDIYRGEPLRVRKSDLKVEKTTIGTLVSIPVVQIEGTYSLMVPEIFIPNNSSEDFSSYVTIAFGVTKRSEFYSKDPYKVVPVTCTATRF